MRKIQLYGFALICYFVTLCGKKRCKSKYYKYYHTVGRAAGRRATPRLWNYTQLGEKEKLKPRVGGNSSSVSIAGQFAFISLLSSRADFDLIITRKSCRD